MKITKCSITCLVSALMIAGVNLYSVVSAEGDLPWIWLVNVDHLYWVRDGLHVAEQKVHPHGHGWSIVNNVDRWYYE